MPKLTWGDAGTRFYESGVDRGVLYVGDDPGVSWSGLVSVNETTSGGEPRPYYFDGDKYLNLATIEEFGATIEAFTYPEEFAICDGTVSPVPGLLITHQRRKSFGFSYRTKVGNDTFGPEFAYKIHLVYNALAQPSDVTNNTTSDSVDPNNFSWTLTTLAPVFPNYRRTAHLIVDSRTTAPGALEAIENILYGNDALPARLPPVTEVLDLFEATATWTVTDHGDGTFTVTGPDILMQMLDSSTFQIESPYAFYTDSDTYTISGSP